MSEKLPPKEDPPPVGGMDLNTIFTLLQSMKEKQDSDSLVYKATVTELQDKISSLELGQQLLTAASPANVVPPRPSAERRQTIFGNVTEVDGNQEIKAVIQPRVLFAKEDLQKVASLPAVRRSIRYLANHNATHGENRRFHEVVSDPVVEDMVNDQRARGKKMDDGFSVDNLRRNSTDDQFLDMMAQLIRSKLIDQTAMTYVQAVIHSVPEIKPDPANYKMQIKDFDTAAFPQITKFIEDMVDNLYFLLRGMTVEETEYLPKLGYGTKHQPGWCYYIMLALDLNSDFQLKETFMLKVTEPMLKEMKNPKELRAALLSEASRLAKMASDLKKSEASIVKAPHGDRLLEVLRSGKRNQKYSSNEGKSPAPFATPNKYSRSPGNLRSMEMLSPGSVDDIRVAPEENLSMYKQNLSSEPNDEDFEDAEEFDENDLKSLDNFIGTIPDAELNAMVRAGMTPTRIFTKPQMGKPDFKSKLSKGPVSPAACYQNIFNKCEKGDNCRYSHEAKAGEELLKRYIADVMRAPKGGEDFIKSAMHEIKLKQQQAKFFDASGKAKQFSAIEEIAQHTPGASADSS